MNRRVPHINFVAKKENRPQWKLSRKNFIRTSLAGGLISQLPVLKLSGKSIMSDNRLSENKLKIIEKVQEILFPSDAEGPGAREINANGYLLWVISDAEKDPDEVKYIKSGADWLNEMAEEIFSGNFLSLSSGQQEELVGRVSNESWGESWLSVILSLIFEALLCNPQYEGNPDKIGWTWLKHTPGQPQPSKKLLYPTILDTIRK